MDHLLLFCESINIRGTIFRGTAGRVGACKRTTIGFVRRRLEARCDGAMLYARAAADGSLIVLV